MDSIFINYAQDDGKMYSVIEMKFYRYGEDINENLRHRHGSNFSDMANAQYHEFLLSSYHSEGGEFTSRYIYNIGKHNTQLTEELNHWRGRVPPYTWK